MLYNKSSVDPQEINKFSQDYTQWWDVDGPFSALHIINPIRIDYIMTQIKQKLPHLDLSSMHLIDVGCGGGLLSVPLHSMGLQVTGIDANESNITAASTYAQLHNLNINYFHSTVENYLASGLPAQDVVVCCEVIEHVANPTEFIRNLAIMVKPEGLLIITTINRTISAYFYAILIAEYLLRWIPKNTHHYSKFIKPSEIMAIVADIMHLFDLKGLEYQPLTNQWSLSENVSVNYFMTLSKNLQTPIDK